MLHTQNDDFNKKKKDLYLEYILMFLNKICIKLFDFLPFYFQLFNNSVLHINHRSSLSLAKILIKIVFYIKLVLLLFQRTFVKKYKHVHV